MSQHPEDDIINSADELGVEDVLSGQNSATSGVGFIAESPADRDTAIEVLSQVTQFRGLPRKSLEALAEGAMQCDISEGEYLFVEGDAADSFFVVA